MKQEDLESLRILFNAQPQDDFLGLSANEMHTLLYEPFSKDCVVQLNPAISESALQQSPFYMLTRALIDIIKQDGSVKLTSKGFINKKTLVQLYELKFFTDEFIEEGISKIYSEEKWIIMHCVRLSATMSGLFRKYKGQLVFTSKGRKFLETGSPSEIFRVVFLSYARNFNWGFNDLHPEMNILQQLIGFSVYLLGKFGNVFKPASFYMEKILKAYPHLPETIRQLEGEVEPRQVASCFRLRFFERFMLWFGLVEAIGDAYSLDRNSRQYKTSKLFKEVFTFNE
jgi:hypothetical protein